MLRNHLKVNTKVQSELDLLYEERDIVIVDKVSNTPTLRIQLQPTFMYLGSE